MAVAKVKTAKTSLKSRKMLLYVNSSLKYTLPRAPVQAEVDLGRIWRESDRVGRTPIIRDTGKKPKVMTLSFELGTPNGNSIWTDLKTLSKIANSDKEVEVTYTPNESGRWIVTDFSYQITHRNEDHDPRRASVSMTFRYSRAASKDSQPTKGGGKTVKTQAYPIKRVSSSSSPKRYTVKKGDTLWDISRRFYGDQYKWRKIADANKITNQYRLKIGTVLRIP